MHCVAHPPAPRSPRSPRPPACRTHTPHAPPQWPHRWPHHWPHQVVFFTFYQELAIFAVKSLDSHQLDGLGGGRYAVQVHSVQRETERVVEQSWCLPLVGCLRHTAALREVVKTVGRCVLEGGSAEP
jgi:hypothetical protein